MSKFFSSISQRTADAENAVYQRELNGLPRAIRKGHSQVCETELDSPLQTVSVCWYALSGRILRQAGWHRRIMIPVPAKLFALGQDFYFVPTTQKGDRL